jgi:hypothetical protein
MGILIIAIACVLSAILYRMGGSEHWNTKWRDAGCPLVALAAVWLLDGFKSSHWLAYMLFYGASWAALTTYWDKLNKGNADFFIHGLVIGLAGLFLIPVVPLWILVLRVAVSSIGMDLWSRQVDNDVLEECGRGVFFIL